MKNILIICFVILTLFLVACSNEDISDKSVDVEVAEDNSEVDTEVETENTDEEIEVETGMIVEGSDAEDMIVENLDDTKITLSELSEHNNEDDCWVAYSGKVYDITSFLSLHKSPLGKYCGTSEDFERAYLEQHKGTKDDKLGEYDIGVFE